MEFKDKLKEIRKNKKLTQEQLANKANISVRTIANYESGKREPNVEILVKICNALNIQVNDLFDNNDIFEINKNEISKIDKTYSTLREINDSLLEMKNKELEICYKRIDTLEKDYDKLLDSITENRELEIINDFCNDPTELISFLIRYFNFDSIPGEKCYINPININKNDALNIINSLKDTLEFELYKIQKSKK